MEFQLCELFLKLENYLIFIANSDVQSFNRTGKLIIGRILLRIYFQLVEFVCLFLELPLELVVLILKVLSLVAHLFEFSAQIVNLLPQHLVLNSEFATLL